jgi:hypothetical protein
MLKRVEVIYVLGDTYWEIRIGRRSLMIKGLRGRYSIASEGHAYVITTKEEDWTEHR